MDGVEPIVWVIRHGETEWSRTGRHTSRTELDLTQRGQEQALSLQPALAAVRFDLILCSPRRRAQETAELAGLVPYTVVDDLREWDYGEMEGRTSTEIQEQFPGWRVWEGPWPGGETAAEVSARADRVIAGLLADAELDAPTVALVGHGHFSRVLAARWVGADAAVGRWLDLDTGTTSQLGWVRHERVVRRWNAPAQPIE